MDKSRHRSTPGHATLLLLCLLASPGQAATKTDATASEMRALQAEWAGIFYEAPKSQQASRYKALLERVRVRVANHPERAEPLIVEAIILCTYSAAAISLNSLSMLEEARSLLQKAIDIDPPALDGAAYVTLGNLYRRLPGWPLLYGDKALARQYFETGVKLYPEGLDTNYFYGDYLLSVGDYARAEHYLAKASRAPIRPSLKVSDTRVKEETEQALADARARKPPRSDFFSIFTPSFDTE